MHALDVQVGNSGLSVLVFSPKDATNYGLKSWSLRPLQNQFTASAHHLLTRTLFEEMDGLGIKMAFAPAVSTASADIAYPVDLTEKISLKGIHLYRNKNFPADGVFLEKNQAFVMSGAGCPIVIATAGRHMIVAHAARNSLIDRDTVNGKPLGQRREHMSVVEAIIEKMRERGAAIDDIHMTMLFSIPALEFEHSSHHPKYGTYNRLLEAYVNQICGGGIVYVQRNTYLDLEKVFSAQARHAGVPQRQIHTMCSLAKYPELEHTADSGKRNLFIVKRI